LLGGNSFFRPPNRDNAVLITQIAHLLQPTAAIAAMEFDLDSVTAEAVESLLAAAAASVDDVNRDGNGGRGEQLFQQGNMESRRKNMLIYQSVFS
jgi:glutamate synthase domain-containing protein 2